MNALALAFTVQIMMIALSVGTGVSVNVMLARSLGQQNREKASRVSGNAIFLGIVITAVFMLFGMFGVNFTCRFSGLAQQVLSWIQRLKKLVQSRLFGIKG